ncbi:MAG TPA: FimV/HubP family polar landmark protein [Gammaproteobacteria bacterium]|jgi:FimV-like protein|nr:FimV/HubP family polar landmark protein [Gammaproteobacteria bacterium]
MSKKLIVLLALVSAALPMAANALGLGEIKLNSALNDKFNADIPVVGATSDELDSLDVKLAGLNQFTQAGLDRPGVLDQLQFVVVRNPDGTSYIHITSNAAVREPFLDFLVDANWNNGELIREYTVLLNPPTFQTANAAPSAPAPQPAAAAPSAPVAAAPVPVPVPTPAPVTQTAAPVAQPPAEVAAAPQPPVAAQPAPAAESTPAPAASPPPAPAPSVEQAPAQRALGTNYGPIHRGETLSSIARSVRPDGITLNQMMVAIYQANPEVFMHNINRMKSGYILRMPTASDAQAVSVTDANSEVRAQMQAWRSGTPAPEAAPSAATSTSGAPALQLVAPGSAAESNAQVPGAATQSTATAVAPEAPAASMKTPAKSTGKSANPPPLPVPATQPPLAVNSNSLSAEQQQAVQQNAAPALPSSATNVPLPKAAQPKPALKPFGQPAAQSGGGIMDLIFPYGIIALILIALIALAVVIIKKRKGSGSGGASKSSARIKADWMKQESVDGGDSTAASSTTRTRSRKAASRQDEAQDRTVLSEQPTEVAGDSDKTMLMAAPPPAPMQDTMVGNTGGGGSQLDVSDPMAEADFHMAYGLYDQAADVLRKALRQSPDSRPAQVKLLEVYFTAGDRNNFVVEAKKLRQAMGAAPDKDWESVAIMGRQVAPDEPLFSSTGVSAGGAVDISLDGGGTDTVVSDLDALEGAFASAGATPVPEAPAPAPIVQDSSLEFSLPDLEPMAAPEAPAEVAPAASTDFDLGDLNFEPTPSVSKPEEKKTAPTLGTDEPTVATDFGTDSQVEFDKALNDLASFVNTNVPAQPEMGEEPGDDKTLAIRPPKPPVQDLGGEIASADAAGSSMNEIGTKLDLARAYIDMGDPDGAKSILEEVIAEGNAQQKSEAQELIKHVS